MPRTIQMYCKVYSTENEHYIFHDMVLEFCKKNGLTLHYYRELKEGHVPMFREFKVEGPRGAVLKLKETFKDDIEYGKERWQIELDRWEEIERMLNAPTT